MAETSQQEQELPVGDADVSPASQPPEEIAAEAPPADAAIDQAAIDALLAGASADEPDDPTGEVASPVDQPVEAAGPDQDDIDALLADASAPTAEAGPASAAADAQVEAAAREVMVDDADAEFADEGLSVEIDQSEIDLLVAEAAAAEAAGSEGEGAASEPGPETADARLAGEPDEASGPTAGPAETPSDLPVAQQIAALLDAGGDEEAESPPPAPEEEPTQGGAYAVVARAERGADAEQPDDAASDEPVADGSRGDTPAGAASPPPEQVQAAAGTLASAGDAGRLLANVPVRALVFAGGGGVALVLLVVVFLAGRGGAEPAVVPQPESTPAVTESAPPPPTPAPPPARAPNAQSFEAREATADEVMAIVMGGWPLADAQTSEQPSARRKLPAFAFIDPTGDGIDPETGAVRRPHAPEADIAAVHVAVTASGGELRATDVSADGFALAGTDVRIWVDMAAPARIPAGARYRLDIVGRFRNAPAGLLASSASGALVPGSQLAITLQWLDGAWTSQMVVWQPQLGGAVPFGNFAGYQIAQNRIEIRVPVALLQPFMAAGDRADSFDFYVRVEEIVGTRAVVDFAAHGQALETTSNELLELTEMLLRQSVIEAAGAWEDIDPIRARLVARQALSMMELTSSLFMVSVPVAR